MATCDLTAARLRELLHYDPETGSFVWVNGSAAGSVSDAGYLRITVGKRRFRAHRLAWLYVHGAWPEGQIDHVDGDRLNNRIGNLRQVTNAVNNQNLKTAKSNSKSGFLGVHWAGKNKWVARITVNGLKITLGTGFKSPDVAHAVYIAAKRRMHEGCTI